MRSMAAWGLPMHQMCVLFKNRKGDVYSEPGFKQALDYDDTARNAILEGRAQSEMRARRNLAMMANGIEKTDAQGKVVGWEVEPNPQMMKFLCETQFGFKRGVDVNLTGAVATTTLAREEREKLIEKIIGHRDLTDAE